MSFQLGHEEIDASHFTSLNVAPSSPELRVISVTFLRIADLTCDIGTVLQNELIAFPSSTEPMFFPLAAPTIFTV